MKRCVAYIVLTGMYGLSWVCGLWQRCLRGRSPRRIQRLAVVGTFHNPGWFLSHIRPLTQSGLREVILVVDEPQADVDGVRCVCPPPWARKVFTRIGAKALWLLGAGWRGGADCVMGYHLLPNGCIAQMVGAVLARPASFQMTGGPVEVIGGGVDDENPIARRLGHPSRLLERLALAATRQFELVVVRGRQASGYLRSGGLNGQVRIIPGSVPTGFSDTALRDIDLLFVGRLAPIKQPQQFVRAVAELHRNRPDLRAAIVGDGPMRAELETLAERLGVSGCLQCLGQRSDVDRLLTRAKLFVLTSRSEGLSIAMAEAMAAGVVPVVADIGELRDLADDGVNARLVPPGDIAALVEAAGELLDDEPRRQRMSAAARRAASDYCSLDAVSRRWQAAWKKLEE